VSWAIYLAGTFTMLGLFSVASSIRDLAAAIADNEKERGTKP
jgi:hypothetical protein